MDTTGMAPVIQRLFDGRNDNLAYLTHKQLTISRGELRERVAKQAEVFAGYGIGPGSAVGLRTPPSFTQVEVLLTLWRLGAQVMLFDFRLKPAEVEALCASCRPQFMVRAGSNVQGHPASGPSTRSSPSAEEPADQPPPGTGWSSSARAPPDGRR
ncbi:AMP-binding protein [Streptomyces sp. FXJ1.4098]|nr:AMP-binding protein [Streptomyces sp. FXJ1.4098]